MKSKISIQFFGFVLSLAMINTSFGQEEVAATVSKFSVTKSSTAFTYTSNLYELEDMNTKNLKIAANVNLKVLDTFSATFKNAGDVQWYAYDNKSNLFLVRFTNTDRECKVLYNKNGKISYSVSERYENDLSKGNRKLIKAWYGDFDIVGLVEVITGSKTYFLLNLRKDKDLVVLRIEDDVFDELGQYKFQNRNSTTRKAKNGE
jgi:hypothetical protein